MMSGRLIFGLYILHLTTLVHYTIIILDIIARRVVLVGDSAGGNLVAALTVLAIKEKVRIPDGILMGYPALYLTQKSYTPSMLHAIDDGCIRPSSII